MDTLDIPPIKDPFVASETIEHLSMVRDWVLIEKMQEMDGAKRIGSIIIPDSVNTNIRESKIGRVKDIPKGYYDSRGQFRPCPVKVGEYCYYTRYGKEKFDGLDGKVWVFTRFRGVLAYLDFDVDGNPYNVRPLWDRLWCEHISDERTTDAGIILPDIEERKKGEYDDSYHRWRVLAVGWGRARKVKSYNDIAYYTYDQPIPCEVCVGDVIYATKQSGVAISWSHTGQVEKYRLFTESECVAYEPFTS